ncbi:MAG TPA: hypothetical protein PLU58_11025 [Saprospiraceae bacterium]|nr:hypothetical protein [Saprospiraceae bacterium]
MILVPESWFTELLRLALKANQERIEHDTDTGTVNILIGYAKSSESILKYNERQP